MLLAFATVGHRTWHPSTADKPHGVFGGSTKPASQLYSITEAAPTLLWVYRRNVHMPISIWAKSWYIKYNRPKVSFDIITYLYISQVKLTGILPYYCHMMWRHITVYLSGPKICSAFCRITLLSWRCPWKVQKLMRRVAGSCRGALWTTVENHGMGMVIIRKFGGTGWL